MQDDTQPDRSAADPEPKSPPEPQDAKPRRARSRHPLPTARVTFAKQLLCLRSYGLTSEGGTAAVQIEAVGKAVELNSSTVSLCNPFFVGIGLLTKSGRGSFMPTAEILEMVRAYDWDADSAPNKMAPILRESWAARALAPRLGLGPIDVEEAIKELADSAGVGPAHKAELAMVLDYLAVSGVIRRDGHQIASVSASAPPANGEHPSLRAQSEPEALNPIPNDVPLRTESVQGLGMGGVSFTVSIKVDATEIARWSPDRITAFFSGLAQVLAAQRQGEGGG